MIHTSFTTNKFGRLSVIKSIMSPEKIYKRVKGFSQYLKIGLAASLFYAISGGSCICCGSPLGACQNGIAVVGIVGTLSSSFYYILGNIKRIAGKLFNISGKKDTHENHSCCNHNNHEVELRIPAED